MINIKLYLHSFNTNEYDEGTGISFDKTTHSNYNLTHAQIKKLVLEVACNPTITTVNRTLIVDIAATGNYISITIPYSDQQVATYFICI